MIQYLNRARSRKGFTIVELIVVIAIIAVLSAILVPMISARRSKIQEANTTARDFYTAMQMVMTNFSMYEGPLSPAYQVNPNLGEMRYYERMGGNYPYRKGTTAGDFPETASLYVELTAKNGDIREVRTAVSLGTDTYYTNGFGLFLLCDWDSTINVNTEFGNLLKAEVEDRIHYLDGYYYAKVTYKNILTATIPQKMEAETVKVEYTGYSAHRLPDTDTSMGDFNSQVIFDEDYVLKTGDVFGVCAPLNTDTGSMMGIVGTRLN